MGSHSIALPLSSSFPASELQYILENGEVMMLLSSTKFQMKANEVIETGLDKKPLLIAVEKRLKGNFSNRPVQFEDCQTTSGGMMLYTSGTTSRPVSISKLNKSAIVNLIE
jgi:acyl-coenzyme A synthetase/AMP-(fatty) acid ligase